MPSILTNDISLHYEVRGAGPALALIIGYRLHGGAWPERFIEELARHFTVLTFDNRGTGRSDKPTDGYLMEQFADDTHGLLQGLGWERAHVLGFSMGGAVAQDLAIRHPQAVDRLVLFATFAGGMFGVPASWDVLYQLYGVESAPPEEAARIMRPITYSRPYLQTRMAEVEAQTARETEYPTPVHAARGQAAAIRAFSSGLRLHKVQAPTLVATGGDDVLVPPANSRILASRIPGARLAIAPGLGHRAIWEAPDEMARLITGFLIAGEAN